MLYDRGDCNQLSSDHNPYNKKEYERIIKNNGRIHRVKDFYDEQIGPLRVWLQNEETPGLAVTRSFGDLVGKKVGITSEPHISINSIKDN